MKDRSNEDGWLDIVAAKTCATKAERVELVQSLWGGYGELVRVRLHGTPRSSVIVKWVKPPAGDRRDVSHARKVRSYQVETAFYRSYGSRRIDAPRIAELLGHAESNGERLLILEDLDDAGFARRSRSPRGVDLDRCLAWLAAFHARFLGQRPDGLWKTGTYWHLATRPTELAVSTKRDPSIAVRAAELDRKLAAATFRTFVHGDAKPANFCFGPAGVAAVDFQYVGGGPGIVDVAYLLHGEPDARSALAIYFAHLRTTLGSEVDAAAIEHEWRLLYPVAVADFERFLHGWR
ncbi:MAG: phosphotransferase [Polyangiaceae bacterium]